MTSFRIRTITVFVPLSKVDFKTGRVKELLDEANRILLTTKEALDNYEVQTLRIATNCVSLWIDEVSWKEQIKELHEMLCDLGITFCAIGGTVEHLEKIEYIIGNFPPFSCSVQLPANDVTGARKAAASVIGISKLGGICENGLGNFRFCVAHTRDDSSIPFFPVARCHQKHMSFAIGLENGQLLRDLLTECKSIQNIDTTFRQAMALALRPVADACEQVAKDMGVHYLGMDTSLNPSLDGAGSVAEAIEQFEEISIFGGPGTLAAAAALTTVLQSLDGINRTGYCGLMLPLCEDRRLVSLNNQNKLQITDFLNISSVCGVGVDTIPIDGATSVDSLAGLLLDVVGLAARWNKSLSCRVLPMPNASSGDMSLFDSPYMINSKILSIDK